MEKSAEKPAWWKWLVSGGLLLLATGWLGYRWLNPPYEPPVQPVPNGYDELVELGDRLAPLTSEYLTLAEGNLAHTLKQNEPVLIQARELLREDCVVSLNWQANQQWFGSEHLKRIEKLKNLARAFAAEGMQAIKEDDSRQAVNSGLENLHLAKAAANGGLGTDWLSAVATYTQGLMTLRDSCEIATADDCKFVLANLPDVDDQLEPPAVITEREWYFFRRINGAWTTYLSELTYSNNRADFEKHMEASLLTAHAKADLLRLHYAIRAFQLAEGRLPKSLDELAGRELKAIPQDPYNGRDFIYQPGKDRYILYSVGPNGVDDGGFVNDKDPQLGDLVLEPYVASEGNPTQD
jgi:hypothetical protein